MSLSSSCHPLVVNKPHPHSCCGASLQRQCLYFILFKKFHEDILNGFEVKGRTRFCDEQTDRWPSEQTDDPGKNNMSSNPKVGIHNKYIP